MNKFAICSVAAALLGVAALPGSAQETKPIGLSIRAGLFFPSSSIASDSSKTWFVGGLEYKLGDLAWSKAPTNTMSSYSVSIDYYSQGDFRNVPVLLNYVGRTEQFYFTAGAGFGAVRARINATDIRNSTEFAYQVGVGYDFVKGATPVFLEAKYFGSAESRVNGFALMVGARF